METRNIALTLDKAKEWYNSGNEALKEAVLQAFTEDELKEFDFKSIKTFEDAIKVFRGATPAAIADTYNNLSKISKASAASFKLNIIRKVLNKGYKMKFDKGNIWVPNSAVYLGNDNGDRIKIARFKINNKIYTLYNKDVIVGIFEGLGYFSDKFGYNFDSAAFLGCATKEIAGHFGKYFAKEIFEAKYGDLIDYEWID